MHLKPDIDITTKLITRDHNLAILLCVTVIALGVYAFIQDWSYKPVFVIMGLVAFMFLGNKKDIPDETWSPQQKGAWTKRYTTLKIKDGNIIYVTGDSPTDHESYDLKDINHIKYQNNKILIVLSDSAKRKINAKYWEPEKNQQFVLLANDLISKTHNKSLNQIGAKDAPPG